MKTCKIERLDRANLHVRLGEAIEFPGRTCFPFIAIRKNQIFKKDGFLAKNELFYQKYGARERKR